MTAAAKPNWARIGRLLGPARLSGRERLHAVVLHGAAGLLLGLLGRATGALAWSGWPVALAVIAGLVGATRARVLLPAAALAAGLGVAAILWTPVMGPVMSGIVRSDRLFSSPAVVVLAGDINPDGTPNDPSRLRLEHGCDLIAAGYAPRVVVTRYRPPRPSYLPWLRQRLRERGLRCETEEVGLIGTTHTEALLCAALARERGWSRVILVTEPAHTGRAAALFEKAGLSVLCSPCSTPAFDYRTLSTPRERLAAARSWVRETGLYLLARVVGWV